MIKRPITPLEEFEKALDKAQLTKEDLELIEYIRYTSVFTQPGLTKELKRPSKPPLLTVLCQICQKIGSGMPYYQPYGLSVVPVSEIGRASCRERV